MPTLAEDDEWTVKYGQKIVVVLLGPSHDSNSSVERQRLGLATIYFDDTESLPSGNVSARCHRRRLNNMVSWVMDE